MQTFLRSVPLFTELTDEDLARICRNVDEVDLEPGELLFEEGAHGDRAYVIQSGELEIYKRSGSRDILLAHRGPGEIIGEIALFEDTHRTASVRATEATHLIVISREQLDELIKTSRHAAETLFYTVLSRMKNIQAQLRQSEKMAQLGTLTAGVAHELNNPASAVRRSSTQLSELFQDLQQIQADVNAIEFNPEQTSAFEGLETWIQEHSTQPPELDALVRSDLQEAIEDVLETLSIKVPWSLSPDLVDMGITAEQLNDGLEIFSVAHRETLLRWLISSSSIQRLLYEIHAGTERISSIVNAMKSYAYLDQAPSQEVDIHKGLDDTLIIMASKIKQVPDLSIHKEYDTDLPKIFGYGSELNQVWTNLLDNAIDAVEPGGTITIRTCSGDGEVIIEITDDGHGVPADIQDRIFDSFFTTKAPGKGTGLGLDISFNIVSFKHRGDITFTSEPGQTCFTVRLPLDYSKKQSTA